LHTGDGEGQGGELRKREGSTALSYDAESQRLSEMAIKRRDGTDPILDYKYT
jgi:hypothetical protein